MVAFRRCAFAVIALLPSALGGQVQIPCLEVPHPFQAYRYDARRLFIDSYQVYRSAFRIYFTFVSGRILISYHRQYAFGHDDLKLSPLPHDFQWNVMQIPQSFSDNLNGFGASIVDAMSTMVCLIHIFCLHHVMSIYA